MIFAVRSILVWRGILIMLPGLMPFPAFAESAQMEQRLMCTIAELKGPPEKPERMRINCGSKHGIASAAHGNLFVREKNGGIAIAGRIEVEAVHEQDSWVRAEAGSTLDGITQEGVVELPVLLPADIYRGLLLDLYVNGITFLNNDGKPISTLEQVLAAKDDSDENEALGAMVVAGHEVVEFTTKIKKKVSHGKWQGKKITPILEESTPEDYRTFLRFVRDFPGKYSGKQWKISEIYATWLINDAPLSNVDAEEEIKIKAQESKPKSIHAREGDIFYVADDGQSHRITTGKNNGGAVLSPDGKKVAYLHIRPKNQRDYELFRGNEIWVVDVTGKNAKRLLKTRMVDDDAEANLSQFNSLAFSVAGDRLYFLSEAWMERDALHVLNLATGKQKFITGSNIVIVIHRGRYAEHLVIEDICHEDSAGKSGCYFLITPEGKEVMAIGEKEAQAMEFVKRQESD